MHCTVLDCTVVHWISFTRDLVEKYSASEADNIREYPQKKLGEKA